MKGERGLCVSVNDFGRRTLAKRHVVRRTEQTCKIFQLLITHPYHHIQLPHSPPNPPLKHLPIRLIHNQHQSPLPSPKKHPLQQRSLTSQLLLIPSSSPTLGTYPNTLPAFLIPTYLTLHPSLTMALLHSPPPPTTSHTSPTHHATPSGTRTCHPGTCPNSFHTATHRSLIDIGLPFVMNSAWPAAVWLFSRFVTASTCASATLSMYT